jgi:hypothetical protein
MKSTLIVSHGSASVSEGVELTEGSSMLQLRPVAQIAGFDVDADVPGHLWPPIIARYEL